MQHALAMAFVMAQSARPADLDGQLPRQILMQRYPHPPFQQDFLMGPLEQLVALIVVLSFVYPCINTVRVIGLEKERQLKEAMQIMGMPTGLHWLAWFVRSMLYWAVSASVMVALLSVRWSSVMATDGSGEVSDTADPVAVLTHTHWTVLWVYLMVYGMSSVTFCCMMSVFFAKANVAAAVAGLVWFTLYLVFVFVQMDGMELSAMLVLAALFSNTGMAMGFVIMLR